MAGLFNEEPTVRLQRTANEQPQIRDRKEAPNVDTSGTERLIEGLTVYGSPLMNAATELLGILVTIRRQGAPRDINRFRQQHVGRHIPVKRITVVDTDGVQHYPAVVIRQGQIAH